ncbi:MAG: thioredoxin fold domain-containing protein [Desulfarculaceae bacterium]|nr:thioredoxin fold domain-containing protein [Desulfarculaceae bacterium]MCF8072478.1 thioredoxin fold domain-containing protein [Desulfarculaceae bacterium]MCF8102939.1 thioredoxin fold domain-containing protein [Desulfarculaceae bacterium]MCF8117458.1 thioredoxin fold domain-containing protein [Desulfarculaceae bacterium]
MALCLLILCLLCGSGPALAGEPAPLKWMGPAQLTDPGRAAGRPALVYFSAPWCYLCRKMQRLVFPDPEVSAMMSREFDLVMVDISAAEKVAEQYAIKQVPTVIFLSPAGKQVLRLTGYLDRKRLTQAMRFVAGGAWRTQDWESFRSSQ